MPDCLLGWIESMAECMQPLWLLRQWSLQPRFCCQNHHLNKPNTPFGDFFRQEDYLCLGSVPWTRAVCEVFQSPDCWCAIWCCSWELHWKQLYGSNCTRQLEMAQQVWQYPQLHDLHHTLHRYLQNGCILAYFFKQQYFCAFPVKTECEIRNYITFVLIFFGSPFNDIGAIWSHETFQKTSANQDHTSQDHFCSVINEFPVWNSKSV